MSTHPSLYYHGPEFASYSFGPNHAFHPIRQELTIDLVTRAGLVDQAHIVPPRPATDEELLLFHRREYVEVVKAAGNATPRIALPSHGLGTGDNPAFLRMHEAAAVRVGATLDAVRRVVENEAEHCANFGGGLHHALRDKASGFCIYNDIGVAIAYLRKELDCKVAYIDLDAHHGDGVQWGFYDDPDVLTISIHESGRYLFPGTGDVDEIGEGHGKGACINIPLLPHTDGESWLECLEAVVPEALDAFRPDIVISQHGCDAHRLDPLTHLAVSTEAMERAATLIHRLAHEHSGGRWVALGGGGYAHWQVVPRAWGLVWATLTDHAAKGELPADWIAAWQDRAPVPLPSQWHDILDQTPIKDAADFEAAWRAEENRKTAAQALKNSLELLKRRRR